MQAGSSERNWIKYQKKLHRLPVEPYEPVRQFRHFAVMPVMDEADELPATLASVGAALADSPEPVALLMVVNHPVDAPEECRRNNREFLRRLRAGERFGMPGDRLFWIDCTTPGRELTRGVGEARRIGMDTGLDLLDPAGFEDSLLFSLDADAWLKRGYFQRVITSFREAPGAGSASIGFRHRPGATAEEERAIRSYEQYLARYVASLQAAGSPYAFQTVGSAMAVRASACIACGGMRMRAAGEDFYFLQALRKIAPVLVIPEILVEPAPRQSYRVPFGTGRAVAALMAGDGLPEFPEAGFAALAVLLQTADDGILATPETFRAALPETTGAWLEQAGFFPAWEKVLKNLPSRPGARRKAFDDWFDGLRTRQFIRTGGRVQSP